MRTDPGCQLAACCTALLLLAGCVVGPDYTPPEADLPDAWHQDLMRGLVQGSSDLRSWWTLLQDPLLDTLIERADSGNLDLRDAVARIQEGRAARGIATGERFPDVDATGQIERDRASEGVVQVVPPGQSRVDTFYSLGGDAFWEIDLWGRITRSIESADASLQASVEDYRDVLVSLYAEVATSYVEVRALQERIRYVLGNVETQRGSVQLTEDRRDAGIGSDLELAQARLNLASTESFVPSLRQQLAQEIHRLGVLLGQHPSALYSELEDATPIPAAPPETLISQPADLMRQRPDVRRAERQLAAQTAEIGVATSALYPELSLVGRFAFDAFDSDLLESANRAYGFGPSLRWNVFDGGRVRNAIRVEDAQTEQALASYEQTVLRALEDVENSMVAYVRENERRDSLHRSVEAAETSAELVLILYKTGLTDFQNLLDMQRSLFEQQDALAESEGRVTQNLIRIYRALGGGWDAGP